MSWILVAIIFGGGIMRNPAIAFHDFPSEIACQRALSALKKHVPNDQATFSFCIEADHK